MSKKIEVTIKKVSSDEPNVSKRHITYDVYHNGKYHKTFNDVNDALDHKEKMQKEEVELDEKVLDIQQRQKRAQIMRRYKSKIERAREISKKRMAPEANIRKRAFVQARQIIRRRVAGSRGAEYEKLGPSEKMAIDRAVEGKQKAIKKLALRLIPRVKQAEAKRLHTFMKGQQIQNQGQPEGKSKESSGSSSVKESLNNLFSEAFAQPDPAADAPVANSQKKMPAKGKSKNTDIIQYNKFQEEVEFDTPAFAALFKKSEKSGIDLETLGEVYNRGWNSWTEGLKVTQEQYAFARVNSYINQGKTYFNEDADLHEGRAPGTPSIKRYTRNDGTTALKSLNKWGKRKDWRDTEGGLAKAKEHAGVDKITEEREVELHDGGPSRNIKKATLIGNHKTQKDHVIIRTHDYLGKPKDLVIHKDWIKEEVQQTNENFIDGKGPGKPGDAARHGLKGKSASELRKIRSSETASPRKKQLAHWLLNMHHNEAVEEGLEDPKDNPCWKGYKPVGTKKLRGKTVPNCVPEAVEKVVGTNCRNCSWWKPGSEKPVTKEELNKNGGLKAPNAEYIAMSKRIDLGTLPGEDHSVKIKGFCEHEEINDWVTERMCCSQWDADGMIRDYKGQSPVMKEEGESIVHQTTSPGSKVRKKIEVVDRKPPHTEYTRQAEIKTKVIDEKVGNVQKDPKKREVGTDSLVKAYKADTPFSESLDESFNIAFAAGVGVTLTAADLGIKAQGGFAYHPSVLEDMEEVEEEVRSADTKGVVVRTADGKAIVRKQKVNRKIIGSGNLTDGKPDDTV